MRSTCAVVVTYNRLDLLKKCINALLSVEKDLDTILVINNCSTDGTLNFLKTVTKDNPKIIAQNLKENIGGARGFEYGVKYAAENTKCDYYWIMDDDTIVRPNSLKLLVDVFQKKDNVGFVCSNVRWVDGSPVNVPKIIQNKWTEYLQDGLVKVESATFVSVLVSSNIVRKIGLPSGDFIIWGDDTEYTTRISKVFDSYLVIDSIVTHDTPNNTSKETILNVSPDRLGRYYYLYRNTIFIDKKYSSKKIFLKHFLLAIWKSITTLIRADHHKFKKSWIVFRGAISSLMFNPKINSVRNSEKL